MYHYACPLCAGAQRNFPDQTTRPPHPVVSPYHRPVSPNNVVIKWEQLLKRLQRYTFVIGLQGAGKRCRNDAAFLSLLLVEAEGNNTVENERGSYPFLHAS